MVAVMADGVRLEVGPSCEVPPDARPARQGEVKKREFFVKREGKMAPFF